MKNTGKNLSCLISLVILSSFCMATDLPSLEKGFEVKMTTSQDQVIITTYFQPGYKYTKAPGFSTEPKSNIVTQTEPHYFPNIFRSQYKHTLRIETEPKSDLMLIFKYQVCYEEKFCFPPSQTIKHIKVLKNPRKILFIKNEDSLFRKALHWFKRILL